MNKNGAVNSRAKGATFERTIVNLFKKAGFDAEREQQFRGNTGDAKDIRVAEFSSYHFECKFYKSLGKEWWKHKLMKSWIAQCERDSQSRPWFLIFKENFGDIYVLQKVAISGYQLVTSEKPRFKLDIFIDGEPYVAYLFEDLFVRDTILENKDK